MRVGLCAYSRRPRSHNEKCPRADRSSLEIQARSVSQRRTPTNSVIWAIFVGIPNRYFEVLVSPNLDIGFNANEFMALPLEGRIRVCTTLAGRAQELAAASNREASIRLLSVGRARERRSPPAHSAG